MIDHIDHICQIAGNARHCGIGSDLDGAFGTRADARRTSTRSPTSRAFRNCSARGYSDEDVALVAHGNFIRFLRSAWS